MGKALMTAFGYLLAIPSAVLAVGGLWAAISGKQSWGQMVSHLMASFVQFGVAWVGVLLSTLAASYLFKGSRTGWLVGGSVYGALVFSAVWGLGFNDAGLSGSLSQFPRGGFEIMMLILFSYYFANTWKWLSHLGPADVG
jgi:hypothetical protein